MRTFALAVVLVAFATATSAKDLLITDVAWKSAPTRDEVDAAFPKASVGQIDRGGASFLCRVPADGMLTDCTQEGDYPPNRGFEAAARSLLGRFVAYAPPEAAAGKDHVFAEIRITMRDPSRRADAIDLVDPDVLQRPDTPRPTDPFPDAASKAGVEAGEGVVSCIGRSGSLADCTLVSETPAGLGFGQAAMAIAKAMTLNPWQDGDALEGSRLRVPIYLVSQGAAADPTFHRTAIFDVPKGWSGTAGPYYPDKAFRMNVNGAAVIQCVVTADGQLNDCAAISETPADYGFIPAALRMAIRGAIKAAPRVLEGRPLTGEVVQVDVPFDLHLPRSTPPALSPRLPPR